MPSHYIYASVVLFCAPLILSVIGTFTALAIVTSSLAIFVISIRLGFLVMEFSGGFVLDCLGWCVKKVLGEHPSNVNAKNKKHTKDTKDSHNNNIKSHHGKKYRHNSNKSCIKQFTSTTKLTPPKVLEPTKVYNNIDGFVSNDDYFITSTISNNKRPNGRRTRSDFIL